MSVIDYQALILASGLVWRFIATIRTPILHPIKQRLTGKDANGVIVGDGFTNGAWWYSAIVWVIAFLAGYALAATAPGETGSVLHSVGWLDEYIQIGWAATATLIACGSGGLRVAEKMYDAKTTPNA